MSSPQDFDFLLDGPWVVEHRRLTDAGTWQEFDGTSRVEPLAGGFGHLDRLVIPASQATGAVEAFTIRLFDPGDGAWRVWWSSSTRPGHLDPPMTGRFVDGVGTFEGDDAPGPVPTRLRFVWQPHADGGPRWEQARSADGGATWHTDWTMDFRRGW